MSSEYPLLLSNLEDFVRIVDATNLSATMIDDRQTVDAMWQIFKIVWEKGA